MADTSDEKRIFSGSERRSAEAFTYFCSLGGSRTYAKVAEQYGVSDRTVEKWGADGNWQRRAREWDKIQIEQERELLAEEVRKVAKEQLSMAKFIRHKAFHDLKTLDFEDANGAVKAIEMAMKQERLILGEPSERAEVSVKEEIQQAYDRWLVIDGEDDDEEEQAETA